MSTLPPSTHPAIVPIDVARGQSYDVIVVGAGHNGLVAALCAARAGLRTLVVERASVIGGATRTEYPFAQAPDLPHSTGAYLLGLMPPELLQKLELELPVLRRDPHYFLPRQQQGYLLFGSDQAELERQFVQFFSRRDFEAHLRLQAELAALRDDIAPTWFSQPYSIEETAERYVRSGLRETFVRLCRGSVGEYLDRFGFESDLVKAMYAVTDGFSGLYGGYDTPGTGMNFLIHNMCRLPGSDGTWMIVEGGMGTVARVLSDAFARHGGSIVVAAPVASIILEGDCARGVALEDGTELRARAVLVNADPFRMQALVGQDRLPAEYNARLAQLKRPGSTFKLNLALERAPSFRCLPQHGPQFGPTIHLLPEESVVLAELERGFQAVQNGKLADFPSIEWYMHSTVDRSLSDSQGRISSAFFVQWVPYELSESSWDVEAERYARHLLEIADQFAPGTSSLVCDWQILHPQKIEQYFGISHGHIHHIDNGFGFADRLPHRTPIAGLYSASAGTHPAGSVIGCAGYLAATECLRDLGVAPR
ncbi:MAG TPA: NAD(P)/FAD-dependent oxidoreductase [Polyangiaceae bacterium]|nr:NAD(P)/FAD-dependent oxidoreductase [Polyangiaceae bacterium]